MPDDLDKRILHCVLGVLLVLQNAHRSLFDQTEILLVDFRELLPVSLAFQNCKKKGQHQSTPPSGK
jgi:hypothetical protein